MALDGINIGQELLNVPMGEMIESVALAIAKAQWQLDKSSMTVAEMMSGRRVLRDLETGKLIAPNGAETTKPEVLDSRVYFGYSIDLDAQNQPVRVPQLLSMMELGFTPTFYQFVDTIIEVKIAISMQSESTTTNSSSETVAKQVNSVSRRSSSDYSYRGSSYWGYGGYNYGASSGNANKQKTTNTVSTSQVNASYSQKFGYSAEGSSLLRTKLVPVPPPSILEERIREVMRIESAYEQWNILNLLRTKTESERSEITMHDSDDYKAKTKQIAVLNERIHDALNTLVGGGADS